MIEVDVPSEAAKTNFTVTFELTDKNQEQVERSEFIMTIIVVDSSNYDPRSEELRSEDELEESDESKEDAELKVDDEKVDE